MIERKAEKEEENWSMELHGQLELIEEWIHSLTWSLRNEALNRGQYISCYSLSDRWMDAWADKSLKEVINVINYEAVMELMRKIYRCCKTKLVGIETESLDK